jgi:hypothetical protein
VGRAIELTNSDRGHGGAGLATTLAIIGTALLAIGLGNESTVVGVIGALVLGSAVVAAITASHFWLRSIYRRLDKVDPEDHEALPEKRIRIQF